MNPLNKSRVAVVRCSSYDEQEVLKTVNTGLELLGGVKNFVKPKEKIVLKPNILLGQHPDKCATTHPAVFKAVAQILGNAGVELAYGDSPGFGSAATQLQKAQITGIAQALGLRLADFDTGKEVTFPDSPFLKRVYPRSGSPGCRWPGESEQDEDPSISTYYRSCQKSIWLYSWFAET